MSGTLVGCFNEFLKRISLTEGLDYELYKNFDALSKALLRDKVLSPVIEEIRLQGSYAHKTVIQPKNGKRSDVDILVVTKLHQNEFTPDQALEVFRPFIKKYSLGRYGKQKHSWGINFPNVHIDVVPVVAPSIMERGILGERGLVGWLPLLGYQGGDWREKPLYISNKDTNQWEITDPLGVTEWTKEKNRNCNGLYTQIVKYLKWWRREKYSGKNYLKGYALEYLVGLCCPEDIRSTEEGIVETLEEIVRRGPYKPVDRYNEIPAKNVLDSVSTEQYREFYNVVCGAAQLARRAWEEKNLQKASERWRKLLGNKFPRYSEI